MVQQHPIRLGIVVPSTVRCVKHDATTELLHSVPGTPIVLPYSLPFVSCNMKLWKISQSSSVPGFLRRLRLDARVVTKRVRELETCKDAQLITQSIGVLAGKVLDGSGPKTVSNSGVAFTINVLFV